MMVMNDSEQSRSLYVFRDFDGKSNDKNIEAFVLSLDEECITFADF